MLIAYQISLRNLGRFAIEKGLKKLEIIVDLSRIEPEPKSFQGFMLPLHHKPTRFLKSSNHNNIEFSRQERAKLH